MSQTYSVNSSMSWNYLGALYGIDPELLARYNGEEEARLDTALPRGRELSIPTADELVRFWDGLPEWQRISSVTRGGPTLSHNELPARGSPATVVAARMRRLGHTKENYHQNQPLRSPNPDFYRNEPRADGRAITEAQGWWKCNLFVADALYAAGFDWLYYPATQRPVQPIDILSHARSYHSRVWVRDDYASTGYKQEDVAPNRISREAASSIQPGDVLVSHEARHSTVVTSSVEWDIGPDGEEAPYVRIIDIYGEHWIPLWNIDGRGENVVAIVRPDRPLPQQKVGVSVGGDPNAPPLDRTEVEVLPERSGEIPETLKQELELLSNGQLHDFSGIDANQYSSDRVIIKYNDRDNRYSFEGFDENGDLIRRIEARYDDYQQFTEARFYDGSGALTRQSSYHPNGEVASYAVYEAGTIREQGRYDAGGFPLEEVNYDGQGRVTDRFWRIDDETSARAAFHYSEDGSYQRDQFVSSFEGERQTASQYFSEEGRLLRELSYGPSGTLDTEKLYDETGSVKEEIVYRANGEPRRRVLYDNEGREKLIERFDHQGKRYEHIYVDAQGNEHRGVVGAFLDFFDGR